MYLNEYRKCIKKCVQSRFKRFQEEQPMRKVVLYLILFRGNLAGAVCFC